MIYPYTELIRGCQGMPYPSDQEFSRVTTQFYRFQLRKNWSEKDPEEYVTVGWVLPSTVKNMPWTSKFKVCHDSRKIWLPYAHSDGDFESQAIAEQVELAREKGFDVMIKRWDPELFRVYGVDRVIRVARGGVALFGIQTMGIQLTAYVRQSDTGEMKLWVPRRAWTRKLHPGYLDNTVGGGMLADEDQFECLVREAKEEASLPEDWITKHSKLAGTISYFFVRTETGPDQLGTLDRTLQYVYDVELPSHIVPQPLDGEVEEFYLWTVDQAIQALKEGQFKTNSQVTLIDFLIRHGYITDRNEPEYKTIVDLIHRQPIAV